jgi:uncharacterized membrane protein
MRYKSQKAIKAHKFWRDLFLLALMVGGVELFAVSIIGIPIALICLLLSIPLVFIVPIRFLVWAVTPGVD